MKCVNPKKLPNKSENATIENAYIQVSCGKCYACLSNRRRSWLFRLYNEHEHSLLSLFCTLTYSDDFCDWYLHKEHLQKYFKRLRHHEDFTYYAIGEYGTHTFRPHYHFVMFFKSLDTNSSPLDYYLLLSSNWQYGFSYPARVTYRRLNYVLHYHTRPKIVNNKKTFSLFSKGMGIDFLNDDMIDYLCNTHSTTIKDYNGNTYVIPRYYRKKLIEQGFPLDPPEPVIFDSDNWKLRLSKAFNNKPIYQLSSQTIANYMHDVIQKDKQKIINYNNQDKLI